jgi:urease alpha subunit
MEDYKINWTEEKKEKVINEVEKYLAKYGISESISQGDDAQIEAISLACKLSDIVEPEYNEEYES